MFSKLKKMSRLIEFVFVIILIFIAGYILLEAFFPVKYLDIIDKYAQEYNLDPAFVCAVINAESGFEYDAVSHRGASGLMQIMPQTADWAASEIQIEGYTYDHITDPDLNIRIGCWYMAKLDQQYGGQRETALAAYNAGSGTVSKWLNDETYSNDGSTLHTIPYKETKGYVDKINLYYKIYQIRLSRMPV